MDKHDDTVPCLKCCGRNVAHLDGSTWECHDCGITYPGGPMGWWHVFRTGPGGEQTYIGYLEATSEGWDEMGCDLYTRMHEADLIDDPELLEAAEADIDRTIALIYTEPTAHIDHPQDRMIYYSTDNVTADLDAFADGFGVKDACVRWMDFHGVNDDRNGWQCSNDCTGCIYNDGKNTCWHPGISRSPLNEA